jgi:hypothetical protein
MALKLMRSIRSLFNRPRVAGGVTLTGLTVVMVIVAVLTTTAIPQAALANGIFTTSTVDSDGASLLDSNTVLGTTTYDATTERPDQLAAVGVDPNWRSGVTRRSSGVYMTNAVTASTGANDIVLNDKSFTVEAWYRRGNVLPGDQTYILAQGSSGVTRQQFHMGYRSLSVFTCALYGDDLDVTTSGLTDAGEWHHWTCAFDATTRTMTMYRDGRLVGTRVAGGAYTGTGPINLNTAGGNEDGTIGALRITNNVLYTKNFTPDRRLRVDDTTMAVWNFDEGSGSTATDEVAGIVFNLSSPSTQWVAGTMDVMDTEQRPFIVTDDSSDASRRNFEIRTTASQALSFDGVDDYLSIPHSSSYNYGKDDQFTVEMWVRIPANQAVGGVSLSEKYDGVNYPFTIRYYGQSAGATLSGRVFAARYDGANYPQITGGTRINTNAWTHIAFVKVGGELRLYINGMLDGTTQDTTTASTVNTNPITISSRNTEAGNYAQSTVDSLRISNGPRYTSSSFTPPRRMQSDTTVVGLWQFDEGSGTSVADSSGFANTATAIAGPTWALGVRGITTPASGPTQNEPWALSGYAARQNLSVTNPNTAAAGAGYIVESSLDRGALMDSGQLRPDSKDFRVVQQRPAENNSVLFSPTGNGAAGVSAPASALPAGAASRTMMGWVNFTVLDHMALMVSLVMPWASVRGGIG